MICLALASVVFGTAPSPALAPNPASPPARRTPWDPIFRAAGTTAQAAQVSATKWRGGGAYSLPLFDACWDDWRRLEPTTRSLAERFLRASDRPADALAIERGALSLAPAAPGLRSAGAPKRWRGDARARLAEAILACGGAGDRLALEAALKSVPLDVAAAAYPVLAAMPEAERLRLASTGSVASVGTPASLAAEAAALAANYDLGPHGLALLDRFDLAPMAAGAELIARLARPLASRRYGKAKFDFEWPTALGKVVLGGGGGARHALDGVMFLLDVGAKNAYVGGPARPGLRAVIDVGGASTFTNCGAALFGIDETFEGRGDDVYACDGPGEAAAAFGVAVMWNGGGGNRYSGRDVCQGAAFEGEALLANVGGGNRFRCRSQAQGYGGTKGFGCLATKGGDDEFTADDATIDLPSPQTAQHNTSLAQGCGFGRRADPGDGHSLAGGIGLLATQGGGNRYSCGVFGQGVAYWYSLGALVNLGPRNTFQGVWYVQGSAAHYALGVQLSLGGGDVYTATMAQSQGQGHDYSIGLLHAWGGSSVWNGAGGCLGSGRWNGVGLFAAEGKGDVFSAGGESFGGLGEARPAESNVGLFAAPGGGAFKGAPAEVALDRLWLFKNAKAPLVLGGGFAGKPARLLTPAAKAH